MRPIIVELDSSLHEPLYIQLYKEIKEYIISGEIKEGEKLPSLKMCIRDRLL